MRKYRKHRGFGKSRKKGKQAFLLHIVKQQQTVNYEKRNGKKEKEVKINGKIKEDKKNIQEDKIRMSCYLFQYDVPFIVMWHKTYNGSYFL